MNFIWLKNKSQYFQIIFLLLLKKFWFQLMETKQKCSGWGKVFCLKISYSEWKLKLLQEAQGFEPQRQVESGILMLLGHSFFIYFLWFFIHAIRTLSLQTCTFHVATDSSQGIHFTALATRKRKRVLFKSQILKKWTVIDQARVKCLPLDQQWTW